MFLIRYISKNFCMKVKSTLITTFLFAYSFVLVALENIKVTPKDLQNISKRWSKYHPGDVVFLNSGGNLLVFRAGAARFVTCSGTSLSPVERN